MILLSKLSRLSKLVLLLLVAAVCGCASLPPLEGRSDSSALGDTGDTRLGRTEQ